MKAEVKTAFPGRPDNETATRTIEVGEIIEGDLAQVAVDNKWAVKVGAPAKRKAAKADEPKDA
jgi:hypothetical protein